MKKVLHEQNLLMDQHGRLIGWGTNDVKNVLKSANEAVVSEEIRHRGTYKQVMDMVTYEWLERIVKEGISKQIITALNKPISHIEYRRALMLGDDGQPYWRQAAVENEDLRHPQLRAIYVITHLLAMGELDKLKRCQVNDCKKFYLGPDNKKWCSKKCGSLFRVRQKRKKDRY